MSVSQGKRSWKGASSMGMGGTGGTGLFQSQDEPLSALLWLLRLRWASLGGQALTILFASFQEELIVDVPTLLFIVALGALSNLFLFFLMPRLERLRESQSLLIPGLIPRLILGLLFLDVLLLTALLWASGGPTNPFSVFYLVHVVLGGLVLQALGAWSMAVTTVLAFGLLFFVPVKELEAHAMHHGASSLHFQGMWFAYALAAIFLATFVSGLARALNKRKREVEKLRLRQEKSERLAVFATLAANAAHNLGSPLTTILVVTKELQRMFDKKDERVLEDLLMIREEVERCRSLLKELSQRSGRFVGEKPVLTHAHHLWAKVKEQVAHRRGLCLRIQDGPDTELLAPVDALVQALSNLVENAQNIYELRGIEGEILVGTDIEPSWLHFWVKDSGGGFAKEILDELGDAFVTSREGEGLGLGIYLAQALARDLLGSFKVESEGKGSKVTMSLPVVP